MGDTRILAALFEQTRPLLDNASKSDVSLPVSFLDDLYMSRDTEDLLLIYSKWCRRLTKSDRCSVSLDDGADAVVKHALDSDFAYGNGIRHDVNNTAVGEVFQSCETVFIPDLSEIYLEDTQQVSAMGYRAAILAPIVTGSRSFGTLASSYRELPCDTGILLVLTQAIARCLATQLLVIKQMENLNEMAQTDALTGAKNRHFLMKQLGPLWEGWRKSAAPFCYVSIDIDHFKRINDAHGHDVGDAVLCEIVRRLQSVSRQGDHVVRTGGEEFGIILRDLPLAQAIPITRRLKAAVTAKPFDVGDTALDVTISVGLANVTDDDRGIDDALKRSDAALYHAKKVGRDLIVVSKENEFFPQDEVLT
ncbi:diguanylate cyclase [Yoonia sp. BS5-3]|uniref:diguanylate cyclase n=1 Tax=Yoonia phaeophyticola TaxID=3137369 RepID=A0ABZ2V7I7_9RHOB